MAGSQRRQLEVCSNKGTQKENNVENNVGLGERNCLWNSEGPGFSVPNHKEEWAGELKGKQKKGGESEVKEEKLSSPLTPLVVQLTSEASWDARAQKQNFFF